MSPVQPAIRRRPWVEASSVAPGLPPLAIFTVAGRRSLRAGEPLISATLIIAVGLIRLPGPGSKRNGRRVDPAAGVGLSPNALRALQPGLSLRPGDGTSTPPLHVDRARSQCVRRPVFFDYQQERLRAAGGFGVDFTNHRARFVEELDPVLHLSAAWRSPPYAAPPSSIADVCQDYYASVRRQENGRRVAPGADLVRWTISGRSPGPHGDSVHNHALKNVLCRPVVLGKHSPPYDLGED